MDSEARCVICKLTNVTREDFCHGCKQYVCEGCDKLAPDGKHEPYQHERSDIVDPDALD